MHAEKQKISIARPLLLTLMAGVFALGIFVGAGMNLFTPLPENKGDVAGNSEGFRFIRPVQEGKTAAGDRQKKELKYFQDRMSELIESSVQNGDATNISFYFRDLSYDNWFGIGDRDKFTSGNRLKIPLMIAYFKWAETSPQVLRTTLTYTPQENIAGQDKPMPVKALEPGKAYSVNDLISRMITVDDAAAYALLRTNLPAGRIEKVFKDLDVGFDESLTLHTCAAFYRVLFNASYLSGEMSEKALRHLYKSTSKEGMVRSLPQHIDIAGTHDERSIAASGSEEEPEELQIHEFGIIYHPSRPFLLGVVVKGNDAIRMNKLIRDIALLVYREVDRQS